MADRVAPAAMAADLMQMRRAKGQVDGIQRMIEDGRYCADIIVQITAARASLQAVAKDLLARPLEWRKNIQEILAARTLPATASS